MSSPSSQCQKPTVVPGSHIHKKYLKHCPKVEKPALYLTPPKKPKDAMWYIKTPIGHDTLAKTVARVCQAGGITGFKTKPLTGCDKQHVSFREVLTNN